ncbi:hypothetical protein ACQ4PT_028336 [Festuca glaucescens]
MGGGESGPSEQGDSTDGPMAMLDQVDRRYKHYHQQMQMVVSTWWPAPARRCLTRRWPCRPSPGTSSRCGAASRSSRTGLVSGVGGCPGCSTSTSTSGSSAPSSSSA